MKVAIIHSIYQKYGGEEMVVESESSLLGNVRLFTVKNTVGLKGLFCFIISIYNPFIAYRLKKFLRNYKPDIVHIHNLHFSIGPIAIRVAKSMNIPVVYTLHNYRLLCPSATLVDRGKIFEASLNQDFPWNAVLRRVYRNSILLTFWAAFVTWFHLKIGTWAMIDKFIALTNFGKDFFINSKLKIDPDKIVIKPNFTVDDSKGHEDRRNYYLFAGRLSEEKGISVLLTVFSKSNMNLKIAGDGPLKEKVLNAAGKNTNIQYLGQLNRNELQTHLRLCKALVVPSIWYEPFGLIIIEAFSNHCPVIASDLGAFGEIVIDNTNGFLFRSNDHNDFNAKLLMFEQMQPIKRKEMGANAYLSFKTFYSSEENYKLMINIYESLNKKR